jgi:hypothetical protein
MLTMTDIKNRTDATITPAEAAAVLGMAPQQVRLLARERPETLGFPVITYGSRCRIPRIPFIKYLEGEK